MTEERYRLAVSRIEEIKEEHTVSEQFQDYFRKMSEFVMMIHELRGLISDGTYRKLPFSGLEEWNRRLYEDILAEHDTGNGNHCGGYEVSYANPAYAAEMLGEDYGQLLSFLYTELRGAIVYVFEEKTEYLDILFELFIQIYNQFEEEKLPEIKNIKESVYWYASDYCDVIAADYIRSQIDPEERFAIDIIENADPDDPRHLYFFGEYISENERETAKYLGSLPKEMIQKMADVYTEGYRTGFVNTGKDLSKKSTVNIRYVLGFERVVKRAIENFRKMGLEPVIYRSPVSVLTKRQHRKTGYYGAVPNKQYDYDHKDDQGLFFDKQYVERKLEVMRTTFEQHKELAAGHAGPACIDMFGEKPFSPKQTKEAVKLTRKQEELSLIYDSRSGQITNTYIPGDERSFTIIAYPVPEIGERYEEIFDEIIKINTLDSKVYGRVQQTIIDALDQGEYVHILGGNGNRTDLKVQLFKLKDPGKETIFENCVADVNIPVGEVFTSPVQ